jgi:hypothetical protein
MKFPDKKNQLQPKQAQEANTNDSMELVTELRKLNEIINIKKLLEIVRELTSRLKTCKDPFEQIQIIFDISNKLSAFNGP